MLALTLASAGSVLAADPVKIGVTMPLTGNAAFNGQETVKGMQTAIALLNDKGGILGHQVELIVLDDKASPDEGVNAIKRLMSESHVNAIASSLNSSVGLAEEDVTANKILHVIAVASAAEIADKGYKNVFMLNTTSASKEAPLIDYMKTRVKKSALMVTNDDYGRGLVKMYQDAWKDDGPKIASANFFQLTESNFLSYLTKVKFENPDSLFVAAQSVQLATILKQAMQIGLKPKVIWTTGSSINPTTLRLGGDELNGVISSDNYLSSLDSSANKAFVAAFKAKFPGEEPQLFDSIGYDSIMITALAMDQAQSVDDWQKMAAAMHRISYEGPRGTITFDDKGRLNLKAFLIEVKNRQPVKLD